MTHQPHPDIKTHGLADGCERCEEIARRPMFDLDDANLRDLVARCLANRHSINVTLDGVDASPRSATEAVAMARVANLLERLGRLTEVAPDLVERYFREVWRVPVSFGTPYVDVRAHGDPARR